ncbi:MAG: hypothetical protein ACOC22_01570 [bacterium]
MKNQEVKVNVVGMSATGKSCVMFEIYKALKTAGFEIQLDLKDEIDYENEVDFLKQMLKDEKKRIENVKKKSKIVLKEVRATKSMNNYGVNYGEEKIY